MMGLRYNTSQFKNGLKILIDNEPYTIIANEFEKPGKGQAFTRLKIKNLLNGKVLDRTFKSGQSVDAANTAENTLVYLYAEEENYFFMDPESYEQISIPKEVVEPQKKWLKEHANYQILFWDNHPVGITPENSMIFKIIDCEPNVKGDTATGVMKNATIDTGAQIKVPGFIKKDEYIKIDTRDGSYIGRSNSNDEETS